MIIWTTGIIEAEINASFFQTRRFVQDQLNQMLPNLYFGDAVEKIRIVFIINRDNISEYHRFSKKEKTLDIRVRISYDEFQNSSSIDQVRMFVDAMITSIGKVNSFQQTEFDKKQLVECIEHIAAL